MSSLVVIPTPIGNLEDITLRALRVLRESDLILAEDTRTTATLLKAYEIQTPVRSFHMHNEHSQVQSVLELIQKEARVALVSDAGMPGISDPGYLLVRACVSEGIDVEVLPGPSASITALVGSALPCDRFVFEGFLPHKKGRTARLEAIAQREMSSILYESPTRLVKLLEVLVELLPPQRQVVVARELSKRHEQYHRGTAQELLSYFTEQPPLGEIVVIIAPRQKETKQHLNKYKPITNN